jgi:hypothetical protein
MDKITLSLHNTTLKKKIKDYARKRGLSVSGIVEDYLLNLIKLERRKAGTDYKLPGELNLLLEGIEVDENYKKKDYKTMRDEMYAKRSE